MTKGIGRQGSGIGRREQTFVSYQTSGVRSRGIWIASVTCWSKCAGWKAYWGYRGFGVVGGLVWWICLGEFCCAEEFTEESLTERSEPQSLIRPSRKGAKPQREKKQNTEKSI